MRIQSIEATDFLSFAELRLDNIDPEFTVIVGPNGSGKSNLVHALRLVRLAVNHTDSTRRPLLDSYSDAVRVGSRDDAFTVIIGVEFDQDRERNMWVEFVRAIVASHALAPALPQERALDFTDAMVVGAFPGESIEALLRGRLVVGHDRTVGRWQVAYEFHVDEQPFRIDLSTGWITCAVTAGGEPSANRSLRDLLTAAAVEGRPLAFQALLPAEGSACGWHSSPGSQSRLALKFAGTVHLDGERQQVSARDVIATLLEEGLVLTAGDRSPPRVSFDLSETTRSIDFYDSDTLPVELWRLKNGNRSEQDTYARVRERFERLTGAAFELTSRWDGDTLLIHPVVLEGGHSYPIAFSGTGRWEAIVLSYLTSGSGRVVVLDEPAVNLHPMLLRRVLDIIAGADSQIILITHSPYLVPSRGLDDLQRVLRVERRDEATTVARFRRRESEAAEDVSSRLRQTYAAVDMRSMLFARGVVLVEGEGDRDLLHTWWTSSATGSGQDAPDSLAIAIASVGGDKNFGFVIRALEDWRVPWAIVADGPVLSPDHEMSLQLQLSRVRARDDQRHPDPGASFGDWQIYWAVQGVYTLADTFGIGRSANHEGEIEAHLSSYCPDQWTAAGSLFPNSKTRRIAWFAQNTLCSPRAADLYTAVLRTLTRQAPPE